MIEICSQAISKVPGFPLLQLFVQTSLRLYLVRLTWMKSTAKGSDLENVSMSASLLQCNQCNASHIEPEEQIMFAQHVSTVSMGDGWSVPI